MAIIKANRKVALPADELPRSPNDLPPIRRAKDLLNMDIRLPPSVIRGVLSKGATMVYGGGSKTNKTFALMDLAVSVASGVPWWGFETAKGKVLYMDFELMESQFKDRLAAIHQRKGLQDIGDLDNLDVWCLRGKANDISDLMPKIEHRVKSGDYSLIIIDPIYKVLGERDENAAGDINSLMNELERLAVSTGAAIVVGHHFSKGNQAGKTSMDRISGSGVFARSPDAIVIITRHEADDVFTVEMTLRSFKQVPAFCVSWEYPLMAKAEGYNPAKLKAPGNKEVKFTTEQLISTLGDQELSTEEWKRQCMEKYEMSESTFNTKKRDLLKQKPIKVKGGKGDKWKRITAAKKAAS